MTESHTPDPAHAPEVHTTASGRKPPVPKQKRTATSRVPPREQRHGLVIVNTGDGKGKTTAALGTVMRAWGRGMHVVIFQFIKNAENLYGEQMACEQMQIRIEPLGDGFTWLSENLDADKALAAEGWTRCADALASGEYDVVVFDEMTYPLNYGWLDTPSVLAAIAARPKGTHVIVTGRDASTALIDAADLVTEMRLIKHPYRDQGIGAQPGIDM
jgi:cob(I)alamin adenosyltransferase